MKDQAEQGSFLGQVLGIPTADDAKANSQAADREADAALSELSALNAQLDSHLNQQLAEHNLRRGDFSGDRLSADGNVIKPAAADTVAQTEQRGRAR